MGADITAPNTVVYWLIVLVVIGALEFNGAFNAAGKPTQKYLTSVSGVIAAGLILTLVLYLIADRVL